MTPLLTSRTTLTRGDRDRNWLALWTADGSLRPTYTLAGTVGTLSVPRTPLGNYENPGIDPGYHGGLILPDGLPAGSYAVDAGRGPEATISVVGIPKRKAVTFAAGTTATSVQSAVDNGALDVTLLPGLYQWDRTVTLPADARITGYGAVVKRLPQNNLGTNWPVFQITGPASVYGVEFVGDPLQQAGGMVFYANPGRPGLVVADCVFRRINLGFFLYDALVRDCRFPGGGAVIAPSGCWLRNHFSGPWTQHAFDVWTGTGCLFNTLFEGTDRGPVANTSWGPVNDWLFVGTTLTGIVGSPNGGEMFLHEGVGGINRWLLLHTRIQGCNGPALQWGGNDGGTPPDGGADSCAAIDLQVDGGAGVNWAGKVTNSRLSLVELLRCGLYLSPRCSGNRLDVVHSAGFTPTRGSLDWPGGPMGDARTAAVMVDPTANVLTDVKATALAPGLTPSPTVAT